MGSAGLQAILDGLLCFCQALGITISPSKTEVVVPASMAQSLARGMLYSMCCLSLPPWASSSMSLTACWQLLQSWRKMARVQVARWSARHKALMCSQSFPMMRLLFNAVVRPTISYGSEVWAFSCQLCQLKKREFPERPWLDTCWSNLLGFMRRVSLLLDDSFHLDFLKSKTADARGPLPCADRARGVERQFAILSIASSVIFSGIAALDSHGQNR